MDPVVLLTVLATAAAVFMASLSLLRTVGATRRVVEERIMPVRGQGLGIELTIPSLASGHGNTQTAEKLEQAGLSLTPTELNAMRLAAGLACATIVVFLIGPSGGAATTVTLLLAAVAFLIGQNLPRMWLTRRINHRLRRAEDQLLSALDSMVKSLRAGVGLTQALDYASREVGDPLGPELRRAVRELQLGADIEVVLGELTRRVGSTDLDIASTAMIVQRRVGGNLSEVLSNVTATIRERRAVRAEVHSITAQQRLSGNLAAILPVFIVLFFFAVNPDSAQYLFTEAIGLMALTAAILLEIFGLWLIRRFERVDY